MRKERVKEEFKGNRYKLNSHCGNWKRKLMRENYKRNSERAEDPNDTSVTVSVYMFLKVFHWSAFRVYLVEKKMKYTYISLAFYTRVVREEQ